MTVSIGSGIGRMLARGCVVNGANAILIDVNEKALVAVKTELEGLASSSSSPVEIVTFVCLYNTATEMALTISAASKPTSPMRMGSKR